MGELRVGISGWNYPRWRGRFYPKGLPQKSEMEYATRAFNSIEVNGTFYSLKRPRDYQNWYDHSPPEHVFSIKGGRYITHMRKLREVEEPVANFFASGILALEEKLGPILWQFPPMLQFIPERFERFLEMLPHDTFEAARIGRAHSSWLGGRTYLKPKKCRPIRHAFEIRHESFVTEEYTSLLRRHDVALVVADTGGKWPQIEERTADFTYVRLHGPEELYASGYDDEALDFWARKIKRWKRAGDVFVYFDNDAKVHAPFDARRLIERFEAPASARRAA